MDSLTDFALPGDIRAITLALRVPLVDPGRREAWNARLVGPGDFLEAPGVREVVRTVKGRIVELSARS